MLTPALSGYLWGIQRRLPSPLSPKLPTITLEPGLSSLDQKKPLDRSYTSQSFSPRPHSYAS